MASVLSGASQQFAAAAARVQAPAARPRPQMYAQRAARARRQQQDRARVQQYALAQAAARARRAQVLEQQRRRPAWQVDNEGPWANWQGPGMAQAARMAADIPWDDRELYETGASNPPDPGGTAVHPAISAAPENSNPQHWALRHAEAMYQAWLPCFKAIKRKTRQLRSRHVSNASHAKRLRSMGTTPGAKRYSLRTSQRHSPPASGGAAAAAVDLPA